MKKKQSFERNFIVNIPIYEFDVMISVAEDPRRLEKKILKIIPPPVEIPRDLFQFAGLGKAIMFPGGQCLLWIKRNPKDKFYEKYYGYLNHEILHIVEFIMNRIGQPIGESWNYLIAHLTREIYAKL